MESTMNFSQALDAMKEGKDLSRIAFGDTCYVRAQFPGNTSMNTEPYIVMIKGDKVFPVNLSCESIFAKDWYVISPDRAE